MKVLLISTNQIKPTEAVPWVPVPPLGLACVASSLKRAGHETHLLDLCFSDDPPTAVAGALANVAPDAVGISFRNIETMAYFNNVSFLEQLKTVVDVCRARSAAKIVIGGSGFSVMPEEILGATGADFGVIGEGEWSFPELLSRLDTGQDPSGIPGLASRDNGHIRCNAPDHGHPLDDIPLPDRDAIDHGAYLRAGGSANLQTKRGCPFNCIYCTYPLIEGKHVRCRPARQVADEFRLVHDRYGVNRIYIVDNQFNYPLSHAEDVCGELLSFGGGVKVRWECMLNPGFVSDKLVFLLKMARCRWVDLSVESASDTVLRSLGKNFRKRQIRSAVMSLRKYNLPFGAWILFGGPGENADTVRETLEFMAGLDVPEVLFSIGLRVCPATRLSQLAGNVRRTDEGRNLLDPVFYLSMDPHEIVELVGPFCRERKGWRIAAYDAATTP